MSSIILTGYLISTKVGPLDGSKINPPIKITKDNLISKYFKSGKIPFRKIGRSLEKLVEKNLSRLFMQNIDLAPIQYGYSGNFLVVTKKGSLDIVYQNSYIFRFDKGEKKNLKNLAEIYGPKIGKINMSEELSKKSKLDEEQKPFSADIYKLGGFSIGPYIKVNPTGRNLHSLINLIAHEGTHSLILKESPAKYIFNHMTAYLNFSDGDELIAINETACDVIAKKVSISFKENNLINGSYLYNSYVQTASYEKEISKIITEYENLPKKLRINNRVQIMKSFEEKIKKKFELKPFEINEAILAHSKRYSGSKKISERLNFLYDVLGPREFVKLIPTLNNIKDMDCAYEKFKNLNEIVD